VGTREEAPAVVLDPNKWARDLDATIRRGYEHARLVEDAGRIATEARRVRDAGLCGRSAA
jgi:hypothetical protein